MHLRALSNMLIFYRVICLLYAGGGRSIIIRLIKKKFHQYLLQFENNLFIFAERLDIFIYTFNRDEWAEKKPQSHENRGLFVV